LAERSQVTTHIHCVPGQPDGRRRVMATATKAFIHSKCRRSHQLQAGEIPFIESPVMSRNAARAGRLWKKGV